MLDYYQSHNSVPPQDRSCYSSLCLWPITSYISFPLFHLSTEVSFCLFSFFHSLFRDCVISKHLFLVQWPSSSPAATVAFQSLSIIRHSPLFTFTVFHIVIRPLTCRLLYLYTVLWLCTLTSVITKFSLLLFSLIIISLPFTYRIPLVGIW